jgi:hypothetical protein
MNKQHPTFLEEAKKLKKVLCPAKNTLQLYKVFPKIDDFNYMKYQFYIYVYLNPFKPLSKPFKFITKKGQEHCLAFEPLYIGKASRGFGYRHNQHITAFKNGKEQNLLKIEAFKELEKRMELSKSMNATDMPHDWKEYQLNWVNIIAEFDNAQDLLEYEVDLIKQIGTRYSKTGKLNTLVNKIEN